MFISASQGPQCETQKESVCRTPTSGQMGQNLHNAQDPSWPSCSEYWAEALVQGVCFQQDPLTYTLHSCFLLSWHILFKLMAFERSLWITDDFLEIFRVFLPRKGVPFEELVRLEIQFQDLITFHLKSSVSLEKEGQFWLALSKEIAISNEEIFFKATNITHFDEGEQPWVLLSLPLLFCRT